MPSMIFFLEGLVILVVVLGARGAGRHHEADAKCDDGEPKRALSALDEFCTIQPLASVLRIALFLFKFSRRRAPI